MFKLIGCRSLLAAFVNLVYSRLLNWNSPQDVFSSYFIYLTISIGLLDLLAAWKLDIMIWIINSTFTYQDQFQQIFRS
jgi:hypothetical protein